MKNNETMKILCTKTMEIVETKTNTASMTISMKTTLTVVVIAPRMMVTHFSIETSGFHIETRQEESQSHRYR